MNASPSEKTEVSINSLVEHLQSLRESNKRINKCIEENKKSFLLSIPPLVLIRYVLLYLDESQIITVACTSRALKGLIYSPVSMKILVKARIQSTASYFKREIVDNTVISSSAINPMATMKTDYFEGNEERKAPNQANSYIEDQSAQLDTLKTVKEFLSKENKRLQEQAQGFQRDYTKLNEAFKKEKQLFEESENKVNKLQNEISKLLSERDDHKEMAKDLNLKFQNSVAPTPFEYSSSTFLCFPTTPDQFIDL